MPDNRYHSRDAGEPPKEMDQLDPGLPPQPDAAFDPFEPVDSRRAGGVQELLRKAMVAGLGAVFMTEEGIRAMVKDLKLPKDVVGYVVSQAARSKDDLMRMLSDEMRRFFESAQLREELIRLLSQVTIEVKAEVRLRPGAREVKVRSARARRKGRSRE